MCFLPTLKSAFYNSTMDIVHTTSCLDDLPQTMKNELEINGYWEELSNQLLRMEGFELTRVDTIKTLAQGRKNYSLIEQILKYLFAKAISSNEQKQKYFSGAKYYQLIVDVDLLLKDIWKDKPVTELLPDNDVEPDEYFEFINVCAEPYQNYKVTCDNKKLNESLISTFDAHMISKYSNQLNIIKKETDLSIFKDHINALIPTLAPTLPNYQIITTNIYGVGKILAVDGKLLFVIPENIALALLTAAPDHEYATDLLLSIISANIPIPKPEHVANAVCKKLLGETSHKETFIKSYRYYINYCDLIKYHLQNPSELIKAVIIELTMGNDSISGPDVNSLLSKYNEIKANIFEGKVDLSNMFISKVNSFYDETDRISFDENVLSYIIPIITDNHPIDRNLINDVLLQANEFIDKLDKEIWVSSFGKSAASSIVELYKTLTDLNKYNQDRLPPSASIAYAEVIKSISKKKLPVPTDMDFWRKLYERQTGNLTTTFKDVRDELLGPNHGAVSMKELLFFEDGLFQHGKLDDSQNNIADETLRRILIPLATDDEKFIDLLKGIRQL